MSVPYKNQSVITLSLFKEKVLIYFGSKYPLKFLLSHEKWSFKSSLVISALYKTPFFKTNLCVGMLFSIMFKLGGTVLVTFKSNSFIYIYYSLSFWLSFSSVTGGNSGVGFSIELYWRGLWVNLHTLLKFFKWSYVAFTKFKFQYWLL